jgi:hypothetical protein
MIRNAVWVGAIGMNACIAAWVILVQVILGPAGAFRGSWLLLYVIPSVLAVCSLGGRRHQWAILRTAALATNAVVAAWLLIGFAMVLPQPNAHLWGYSSATIALPPMMAVIAHLWPRELIRTRSSEPHPNVA